MPELLQIRRGATFSRCRRYRWALARWWADGPRIGWIMLNPSTADARRDDPTIRRCMSFSRHWGFAGCEVRNLFGLRSMSPRMLYTHDDPNGSRNDAAILELMNLCPIIVAAWGVHGKIAAREQAVLDLLVDRGVEPQCLGTTCAGHPRHPLYVGSGATLRSFERH